MRLFKKSLAVLLSAVLLFCALPLTGVFAETNTPIVYVFGKQNIYRTDENGNRYKIFDDGEYLDALTDGLVPLLAKGILTGDWQDYADHALGALLPAFEGFAMNPDGTLPENTGISWSWSEETLRAELRIGNRPVYIFRPDSRLSPLVIADQINDFVEAVKRKTGAQKVSMIGRCEGTALVAAYLYKYAKPDGFAGLDHVVLVNGTVKGVGYVDAMMTGNVVLPPKAAYRFLHNISAYTKIFSETDTELDAETLSLISDVVEMLHETYGINVTAALLQKMYNELKDIFFAKLLKAYWGVSLSFVSCVNDHYEDYKSYLFPDDADEWKVVLDQADDFHYNVQAHVEDLLLEADAAGVLVSAVVEYGIQQYPLSEDCEKVGDYMISVEKQSFGATTCNLDETLPDDYIAAQTEKGLGKYISPDRQIDASTCLFPDRVWFVKNLIHVFPNQLDRLYAEILTGATADETTNGRFLNYVESEPVFVKAEAVNANDYSFESEEHNGTKNVIARLQALLQKVIDYVKGVIEGIIGHATGTVPPLE